MIWFRLEAKRIAAEYQLARAPAIVGEGIIGTLVVLQ